MSKIYALARVATPVLNQSNFKEIFGGADGKSLPLDDQKLLRGIETIALPGTKFVILETCGHNICKVATNEYLGDRLYVDDRFLQMCDHEPLERRKEKPSLSTILKNLKQAIGLPYVWGGNWSYGIPEMKEWYPPLISFNSLDLDSQNHWMMKGVDCSGLLFQSTNGYTPRNTSQLLNYGFSVRIENLSLEKIINKLQDLDLIVWQGHVIIVIGPEYVIESARGNGVFTSNLTERLRELMKEKKPVDDWTSSEAIGERFVIRRWHPSIIS